MKKSAMLLATIAMVLSLGDMYAYASGSKKATTEPTVMDKAIDNTKEVANDATRAVKKATREVEDKACEMINGKLDCAAQKAEHAAENVKDKVKDAVE